MTHAVKVPSLSKLVVCLMLLCLPAVAQAQESASISGYVRDAATGETLLFANVALAGTSRGAATNEAGYYVLSGLAPGTYTVVCSFLGYHPFRKEVTLASGEALQLDIALVPGEVKLDEVVVRGEGEEEKERALGVAKVPTALVKQLPAVGVPDLFRALQYLPGVKASSDFSSGLYIRGGGPAQTLVTLDGTTVYNPTHFFGLFSTFNPDAIKDVLLYKGGYPAQYGGRLGSVLAIYNKDGNRREMHGGLHLGFLASRAYVEGPYGWGRDSARGSYMVAVRRSTLEPVLAAMRSIDAESIPSGLYFYDVNAKVNYDLSRRDQLSLALYGGQDALDIEFLEDGRFDIEYGNRTLSLGWTHLFSDKLFADFIATASHYQSTPLGIIGGTRFTQRNEVDDVSVKADLEYSPNERHTLEAGLEAGNMTFKLRTTFDGVETFRQRIQSAYGALYVQDTYRPTPAWEVRGGLRLSYFASNDFWRLAPRLSVEYALTPRVHLQGAYGRYYQFLTLETEEFAGFDTWLMADEGVPPAYGDQYVLGVKTRLNGRWQLGMEGYFRTMNDLFRQDPFLPDVAGVPYAETFVTGDGQAFGVELLARYRHRRLRGFVGYTLSRTERRFPHINISDAGRPLFFIPKFDRTHDLNAVLNYDLTDAWTLTTAFHYATGQAYTEPTFRFSVDDPFGGSDPTDVLISPFNGERLPAYHRLDVSATRSGRFFGFADYKLRFQMINVYARKNVWFYSFDFNDDGTVERDEVPQIPFPIPNISLTLTF